MLHVKFFLQLTGSLRPGPSGRTARPRAAVVYAPTTERATSRPISHKARTARAALT